MRGTVVLGLWWWRWLLGGTGCVEVGCEGRGAGGDGGVDAFHAAFGFDFGDLLRGRGRMVGGVLWWWGGVLGGGVGRVGRGWIVDGVIGSLVWMMVVEGDSPDIGSFEDYEGRGYLCHVH